MALSIVTPDEAVRRLAQRVGLAPDSFEALSDLLRAEVHARRHAPRAATLSRAMRMLAPAALVNEERLDEICDALEREGDLVLAPGAVLYATPTRLVDCKKFARIFSSVPTRALAAALGREISASGATRIIASPDDLSEAVAKINGVMVTPEAWAGLERTPKADAAFLAKLDEHLKWNSVGAGSLEKADALEWRTLQATPDGARWRRAEEGRLWWARTRFGGHHRAWTSGPAPSVGPFVELTADDADRARFALSREVSGSSVLRVERSGKRVTIEVPGWLPRPEYRWLSLHATPALECTGMRWEIAADDEASITKLLAERLGLERTP